jgi:Domain of unknown function (DUF4198)
MQFAKLAVVLVSTVPVLAHDMWIEPVVFSPKPSQIVGLRLRVGQDFIGDPLPRDSALIRQFIVEDGMGRKPVIGRDGGDPAGFLRAASSGMLVVGYHSNPSRVELSAETFNRYLKEEGLDAVAFARIRRKETSAGARELFSRCAKSLLATGVPSASDGDRVLGFTLELTAERNPHTLRDGEQLPVRLTYENQPLEGVLVVAINQAHPNERIALRSGKDGRVRFRLSRGGVWLIKAVHMIPAAANSSADWESFWASLTFEAPITQSQK